MLGLDRGDIELSFDGSFDLIRKVVCIEHRGFRRDLQLDMNEHMSACRA